MFSKPGSIEAHEASFRQIARRAILLPVGLMVVASVFLALLVGHLLMVTHWVDHTDRVIAQANVCEKLVVNMETGLRGFQITGSPVLLEPYNQSKREIGRELDELNGLVADNAPQVERVKGIRRAVDAWQGFAEKLIEQRQHGEELRSLEVNTREKVLMDAAREGVEQLIRVEEALRKERIAVVQSIDKNIQRFRFAVLVVLGLGIGLYANRQMKQVAHVYEMALMEARQKTEALQRSETSLKEAEIKLRRYTVDLEATVAQRTVKLKEMVGQLEAYSYSVSHDLRAPLRAMHGYAKVLLEDFGASLHPEGQIYLERILAASERMDNLIQDVLSYSRLTNLEMKSEPVDLERMVREIIHHYPALNAIAREGGIQIESPLPRVMVPAPALNQCISNLLGNAIKFVPDGVKPQVRIWAECTDEDVRLWVEDKGIGIPAEYQARIFGVFERIPGNKTFEGTGIGLAIVQKAVERMGGQVGVESEVGKGSKFWIFLPGRKL
ncbi:MAG: hypothetical protein JWR19_3879 [Pedosphaera sp.]|nr:hypothetical protein [Pedosphaera sp.]